MITHDINAVIKTLQNGGLAAIPTETVYGLAANACNAHAVEALYTLKRRPRHHPLILHVAAQDDLSRWVHHIPPLARRLIEIFWPGPLTLVFEKKTDHVLDCITGNQPSVAIRCPQHSLTQQLLQSLPFPLVAPSANPFGKLSPTLPEHVVSAFPHTDFPILDGGRCNIGIESTIVMVHDAEYHILRHGHLSEEVISHVLQKKPAQNTPHVRVSGNLKTHYQPRKPLYCFESRAALTAFCQTGQRSIHALLYTINPEASPLSAQEIQYLPQAPEALAFEIYHALHQADASETEIIALEMPPNTPAFKGVRERLSKAASHLD